MAKTKDPFKPQKKLIELEHLKGEIEVIHASLYDSDIITNRLSGHIDYHRRVIDDLNASLFITRVVLAVVSAMSLVTTVTLLVVLHG